MSIYISLACLDDREIFNTVETALQGACGNVSIGIAFMSSREFYEECRSVFDSIPEVSIGWFDPTGNKGVGAGRRNSRVFYNNQDYVLQVDSHTNFEYGWDVKIVNLYNEALMESKNNKTVLTAYLGKYRLKDGARQVVDRRTRYSFFTDDEKFYHDAGFSHWQFFPLDDMLGLTRRFVPSNKFNANFAFGNKHFAKYSGLPESCVFYDEEILQSVNLIGAGYSLVFPNLELPLQHLYTQHSDQVRWTVANIVEDVAHDMKNNFESFVNDDENKENCMRYQEYARYSLKSKRFEPMYIPSAW